MTRWDGFGRTLVFAAAAAAGALAALVLVAPLVGVHPALRVFAVGSACVYLTGLGPTRRRAAAAALAAAAAGVLLLVLPLSVPHTVAAAAGVIAVGRSGILYRSRPLRALVLESLLVAGGLAFASALATGGVASIALAFWGFFLVQSLFFLVGGVEPRTDPGPADPFDRARAELLALIE